MTILKIIILVIFEAFLVLSYMWIKPKKTALFKNIIYILLQVVIITWFLPASYFSEGELVELEMNRIGFFDFFQLLFGSFQFQYFIQILLLLVSIGALYGVLGTTGKYRAWIEKVANKFKRKEILFLIIVATVLALLTSVVDFGFTLFIFIPAIISIILAMGYDKITAILATFGAMIIGSLGATYNENIVGSINAQITDATYTTGIIFKIALLVLSLAALIFFLSKSKINKTKAEEKKIEKKEDKKEAKRSSKKEDKKEIKVEVKEEIKNESIHDMFIGEKTSNKYPVWPIYTILIVIFIILILALTPWTNFNINLFTNIHTKVTEFTLSDISFLGKWLKDAEFASEPFFGSILGTITEFGTWYYAEMAVICLIAAVVIGKIYGKKIYEIFTSMSEGAIKMLKPALMIILAYTVVYFVGNTYSFSMIADKILSITKNFNIFTTSIVSLLGSVLHVDMVYVTNYVLPQTLGTFAGHNNLVALITQSMHGVAMFIAPTSTLLLLGLTYLDIPYKDWIKKTWLLTLVLLAISLVVIIVSTLI